MFLNVDLVGFLSIDIVYLNYALSLELGCVQIDSENF